MLCEKSAAAAAAASGDYHDNVNRDMFVKSQQDKLLPNLKPNSVVVDKAPYHNVQLDLYLAQTRGG